MLSKSQALIFFLAATIGFSGIFLWLTVDTLRQVPVRSNEAAMDESVVRGKEIWDRNNCMGCHTLLGEGAYYAPELTQAVLRRGKPWLRIFLANPEAMFPGQRRMQNYEFTDDEIEDVIAFLEWIGGIDTNGFPPDPDLSLPNAAVAASIGKTGSSAAPRPEIFSQVCVACHSLGGEGGQVGPALDGVADRYSSADLRKWLADPTGIKPGTAMPDLKLSEQQLNRLTAFLMAQGGPR